MSAMIQDGRDVINQMTKRIDPCSPSDNDFLIYTYANGSKECRETMDTICEGLTGMTFGQLYKTAEPSFRVVNSGV